MWIGKRGRKMENKSKQGDRGDVTWEGFCKIYKIPLIWYGDVERRQN